MTRILTWLLAVASLLPAVVDADSRLAKGKLLVATDVVQGELFASTVVLLLHYDETGAFGLVVNRPTEVEPEEVLGDDEAIADYRGTLFWGGPVHMDSLRAWQLEHSAGIRRNRLRRGATDTMEAAGACARTARSDRIGCRSPPQSSIRQQFFQRPYV
jgi:putative AlgH/UPF0301 family transcriptional regulator